MHGKQSLEARAEQEHEPPRHLQSVELADLEHATPPAPEYAVEPLIPYTVVTLLAAHGGAGKSVLALTLAAHYAVGKNWAGFQINGGPAVFVSLEDGGDLVRWRLRKICREHSLNITEVAKHLTVFDGTQGDSALVGEVNVEGIRRIASTATMEELVEVCEGAGLIVIDNASDAFDGDENARRQVRTFVRMLGKLAQHNNAGVLLLAHIDKNAARFGSQGNSYSGSTAWHNSARSRLALVHADGAIELRQEKLNLGKPAPSVGLAWSESGVLIHQPGARVSGPEDAAETEQEDEAAILEAITAAVAAGVNVSAARTGPTNTLVALKTFDLPRWVRAKGGSERFWQTVNRLQRAGRIEIEAYRNEDRKTRERIVVRQSNAPLQSPHPYAGGTGATGAVPRAGSGCAGYQTTGATGATGADEIDDAA